MVKTLADACGITPGAVRHYLSGIRGIPAKHVLPLSKATRGAVSVEELLKAEDSAA